MFLNKLDFSVADAASLLGCSSQTIYSLIYAKKLFAYKIPGHHAWHIPEKAILDYMESCLRHYAHQDSFGTFS